MAETPNGADLLKSVIAFLKDEVLPDLSGRHAFNTQVALRGLGIVLREVELDAAANVRARNRLRVLLGVDGSLENLNTQLSEGIEQGRFDVATPGLVEHMWEATLDKLAIDQPTYPGYKTHARRHAERFSTGAA
jgi:hypothetical protein